MDHFGISTALQAVAKIYFQSGRRTGRTTSLLQCLKDGDRVIVSDTRERMRWLQLVKERELKVEVRCIPVPEAHRLAELSTSKGRTLFEHTWLEKFYLQNIESASEYLDGLQQRLSGWGEAHEKTKRQAEELMRWHP